MSGTFTLKLSREAKEGYLRWIAQYRDDETADHLAQAIESAVPEDLNYIGRRVNPVTPNFAPVAIEGLAACTDCGAIHATDCRRNTLERGSSFTGACPVCGTTTYRPLKFESLPQDDAGGK